MQHRIRLTLISMLFLFIQTGFSQESVKIELDGDEQITFLRNGIGDLRLRVTTNVSDNIFMGNSAGQNIVNSSGTEGYYNTAIGHYSLGLNTTGHGNTALGRSSLLDNVSGSSNTAIGLQGLAGNTTGNDNVALGRHALLSNVGLSDNLALGNYAMEYANNSSGLGNGLNVAVGNYALRGSSDVSANTGKENVAVGYGSMESTTTGSLNVALGTESLGSNTAGTSNAAVGYYTLGKNTTGSRNVGFGNTAAYENTSGEANVAIGDQSLYSNKTGSNNVAIGALAGSNNLGSGSVFIGNKAGIQDPNADRLYIDNRGTSKDSALIYGEFDNAYLRMNGRMEVKGFNVNEPAISGIKQYPSTNESNVAGVYGENTITPNFGIGVEGRGNEVGVEGQGNYGLRGTGSIAGLEAIGDIYGVVCEGEIGLEGRSNLTGVSGVVTSDSDPMIAYVRGVSGQSFYLGTETKDVYGIYGYSRAYTSTVSSQYGVYAEAISDNPTSGYLYGVYGKAALGERNYAGYFEGNVNVENDLSAHTVNFNENVSGTGTGNSVQHAVQIKYIIAVDAFLPINGSTGMASGDAMLGEIRMFAGNFAPVGWAFCDGSSLPISSNGGLFSVLGNKYGGDNTNFNLPNFNAAVPVHYDGNTPNH